MHLPQIDVRVREVCEFVYSSSDSLLPGGNVECEDIEARSVVFSNREEGIDEAKGIRRDEKGGVVFSGRSSTVVKMENGKLVKQSMIRTEGQTGQDEE